jgi:hypothetical protein
VEEHQATEKAQKCFIPDSKIIQYMQERLQLIADMEKVDAADEEFNSQVNRTDRRLRTEKTRLLDKIIFPAMATLMYFFKFLAMHPELQPIFESDIRDLLGINRDDPHKQDTGFIFYDLMDYVLIGNKEGRFGEGPDGRLDFRLILTHIVQKIVAHKMRQSSVSILSMAPRFIVMDDFHKVWAWTELLSHAAEQNANYKVPPTRTIDFHVDEMLESQNEKAVG